MESSGVELRRAKSNFQEYASYVALGVLFFFFFPCALNFILKIEKYARPGRAKPGFPERSLRADSGLGRGVTSGGWDHEACGLGAALGHRPAHRCGGGCR